MDIVIIANFCMDFSENDNGRFNYIAKKLAVNNDVELITSNFYHITKKHRNTKIESSYKLTFLEEPGYSKNVCLKRFYSHFIWGNNVKKYLQGRKKPDVIYCAVPSLTASFWVSRMCEKLGIRFIVDIQDLWPEAFQMILNIPLVSNIIFAPFKYMADTVYRRADDIVAVSATYVKRAVDVSNKCVKGCPVFLGTNLSDFDNNRKIETDFVKNEDCIYVAYCGTLGTSYDIKCVINAIASLDKEKFCFVVMGDGPLKQDFESYAQDMKVNAMFLGRLDYARMCSILSKCDVNINPIVGTSVATIINKHADYAASGNPVINTQMSQEYIDLITEYKMGFSVTAGDYKALAKHLDYIANNKDEAIQMGQNARKCAEEKFDRENSYKVLFDLIEGKRK